MANLPVLDSVGNTKYLKTSGAGTDLDPHIPTDAVTIASGGVASGAVASGAVASGAIASGAVATGAFAAGSVSSGAVASGAIASGAMVAGSQVDGHSQTLGTTTGAAIITDTNGTIQQYLRGVIVELAAILAAAVDTTAVKVTTQSDSLIPNGTQADQALTVDATAGGVQFSAFHADTTHVWLTLEAGEIRYTFDNSAPTTTNGHIMSIGQSFCWPKALAVAAKFIRTGSVSGIISASQLKVT